MKKHLLAVLMILCAAVPAAAQVRVAATIPNLAALAREVGGKNVAVDSLSLPTQDPHYVDARPSLAVTLNRADLLVTAGLQLESGWLPVLQNGARNPKILSGGAGFVDCSAAAKLKEIATGPVDRAKGDIHPGGNPHYLTDPQNAKRCAAAIAAALARIDAARAEEYRKNAAAFAARLDEKIAAWEKRMAPLRGAPVVVYHRSWVYLLDWLGLAEVGALEPKPGIPPTPAHIAKLLVDMRQKNAKLILQESFYPDATSHLLAEKTGAAVIEIPGGPAADKTYADWMDDLLGRMLAAGTP